MCKCGNLKIWNVSNCPGNMRLIDNLSSLYGNWTRSTQLSNFQIEFNLIGLKVLDLNSNQLIIIPTELGKLNNLVDLNLSKNKLSVIPIELSRAINLKRIIFSGDLVIPDELKNKCYKV